MENTNREIIYDVYEKAVGLSELDWAEICEKHNLQCHPDSLRKAGVGIRMAAEAGVLNFDTPEMTDYNEAYKEKQKFYDQRREYNGELRKEAREDYFMSELVKAANRLNELKPLASENDIIRWEPTLPTHEGFLILSDFHYGLRASNFWNEYNMDVADKRIAMLTEKVHEKILRYQIRTLHIGLCGDMIAGHVHVSNRVKAQEDTVEQLMRVSERIAEIISELSKYVDRVYVYTTWGNHSRIIPDLKASIHSDNLERLIPFWLEQRFKGRGNIVIFNNGENELVSVQPCGVQCAMVHGDVDSDANAPTTAAMMYQRAYGGALRYLFTGHLHHIHSKEQFDVEQIGVGSLCGVEDYAKGRRLFSKPSQCFCVFTAEGLDSIHHIDLTTDPGVREYGEG